MNAAPSWLLRTVTFATAVAALLGLLSSCTSDWATPLTRTDYVLDTACTISVYDKTAPATLTQAFALLREINQRMTIDGEHSELIDVNNAAGIHPVVLSPDTYSVVKEGLRFSHLTDGAFDVTVGPLVKLWGIGRGGETVPSPAQIERARSLVDYHDVVTDDANHSVYLKRKGMILDLGGIAKGYAGEAVERLLKKDGVHHAIVDLGGNIVALGTKPDGSTWRIGIQDPDRSRGRYVGIVSVADKAVVTSGKYERYFTYEGKRYHHILSTRTGYPVENGIASVTIIARNSTAADALSTSLFLLGVAKGVALVDSLEQTEAIILTEDKRVYISGGLRERFRITDPEYSMAPPVSAVAG